MNAECKLILILSMWQVKWPSDISAKMTVYDCENTWFVTSVEVGSVCEVLEFVFSLFGFIHYVDHYAEYFLFKLYK